MLNLWVCSTLQQQLHFLHKRVIQPALQKVDRDVSLRAVEDESDAADSVGVITIVKESLKIGTFFS